MHATIRRYEGVDTTRMNEVVGKVNEKLVPQIRELPGFSGYYLIEAGNGVLSSLGLFETPEQADESKTLVTKWISDENFNSVIPNPPKITSGKVVAHSDRVPALV
jgi:hypothetical protein